MKQTVDMRAMRDTDLLRAYDNGNYVIAYETEDVDKAWDSLPDGYSTEEEAAFLLGFFSTFELHEMGPEAESFVAAYEAVGRRLRALGTDVGGLCAKCGRRTKDGQACAGCGHE